MYIAMNRFLINNGKEELFEEIWKIIWPANQGYRNSFFKRQQKIKI